jgi:hypothetical protein
MLREYFQCRINCLAGLKSLRLPLCGVEQHIVFCRETRTVYMPAVNLGQSRKQSNQIADGMEVQVGSLATTVSNL